METTRANRSVPALCLIALFLLPRPARAATPGTQKWFYAFSGGTYSSPAVAKDGTVYVAGGTVMRAITPAGTLKWSYDVGAGIESTPAILPDKSVCFAADNGYLYLLTSGGTLRWSKNLGGTLRHSAAVSLDGYIFYPAGTTLYSFTPEGAQRWAYTADSQINSSPAIGPDGSLYVASTSTARRMHAVNPDGTHKWAVTVPQRDQYDVNALLGPPAIGGGGYLYFGDTWGSLRRISQTDGSGTWCVGFLDRSSTAFQPAIANYGYVWIGCTNSILYGVNPNEPDPGSYQFRCMISGATRSTPAIGKDGTVYIGVAYQTTQHTYNLYALTPVYPWYAFSWGVKWQSTIGYEMYSSPAIGPDGTLYIAAKNRGLYAYNCENTDYYPSIYPKFRHDNMNSGDSGYNLYIRSTPASYDFGNVSLGMSAEKTFTLTNISGSSLTLGQFSLVEDGRSETEFVITSDCGGQTLAADATATFTVGFRPKLNGKRAATVRIPCNDIQAGVPLMGTGGGDGLASLVVRVCDGSNGDPVEGADVTIGETPLTTDGDGECIFSAIPAGLYTVETSKLGYAPTVKDVEVLAASNAVRDVILYPENFVAPVVNEISSKYGDTVFFLDEVDFNVSFTANVDWAGQAPGHVTFTAPNRTVDVPTTTGAASCTFNMGRDFGVGGKLEVQAVTGTGGLSEVKEAGFTVIMPVPLLPLIGVDAGDGFYYSSSLGLNWNVFNEGAGSDAIPSDIPLFGSNPFLLKLIPTVGAEVTSEGEATVDLEYKGLNAEQKIDSGRMAGFSFSLYPMVEITGQYSTYRGSWDWDGYVGLHGEAEFKKSYPFVVMAGPVPIPTYAKASLKVTAEVLLGITGLDPLSLNGRLGIEPYVRGSLGVGADEIFAVEGWIGGGAELSLQWPDEPTLDGLSIYLNGGFTVYALLFEYEDELLRWDWDLIGGESSPPAVSRAPRVPRPLAREYLSAPDYGVFLGGRDYAVRPAGADPAAGAVRSAVLQTPVFPYSEASLSSAGSYLYAVWLEDDPERATLDRTRLVFSSYDGAAWSAPVPVEDDGTADFHPDLLTFSDGSAFVVWENVKETLPDTASFGDLTQRMEIRAAAYDPGTATWTVHAITDNAYMDRSPKVSGWTANDVIIVWVANETNHITGNAANPNKIYSLHRDVNGWKTPPALLPDASPSIFNRPLLGHDVAYTLARWDSGTVFVVDMDDDTGTDTDREIYRLLRYCRTDGERWDTWRRITTDTVSEANPQFVFNTAGNSGYYWVHGSAFVSSGVNSFTVTTQVALDEYSSNLAGFRVAQSASNRNVICWSEPSEYGSDLWAAFRDPVTNTWGNPQQLTFDPELERQTACAFLGNDTLVFLYDKVSVETEVVEEVAASGRTVSVVRPLAGGTGLATVTHQIGTDLAMKPYSLMADPPNPRPGSDIDLYATAVNLGNTSHASVPVAFYAGDPGAGGTLLGTATISGTLVPGREAAVWISCALPEAAVPIDIYAVVDPGATVAGDDPANNAISMGVARPDIAALGLLRADLPDGTIALTGRMRNTGTGAAGPFRAQIRRDSPSGPVIGEADFAGLAVGEAAELRAIWDPSGVAFDALWLYLVADTADAVAEFDESNNAYCLRVNSLMLKGDVDHNGVVDARDAALGMSAAAGMLSVELTLGDMNWDKGIDVSDVLLILRAAFTTE